VNPRANVGTIHRSFTDARVDAGVILRPVHDLTNSHSHVKQLKTRTQLTGEGVGPEGFNNLATA